MNGSSIQRQGVVRDKSGITPGIALSFRYRTANQRCRNRYVVPGITHEDVAKLRAGQLKQQSKVDQATQKQDKKMLAEQPKNASHFFNEKQQSVIEQHKPAQMQQKSQQLQNMMPSERDPRQTGIDKYVGNNLDEAKSLKSDIDTCQSEMAKLNLDQRSMSASTILSESKVHEPYQLTSIDVAFQLRKERKRLREIEQLEEKMRSGTLLDRNQMEKVKRKHMVRYLIDSLQELQAQPLRDSAVPQQSIEHK